MDQVITINHINELKSAKAKFGESGDLSYDLTFGVVMQPGDLERLLLLFKQRLPGTKLVISNPQSRMDLRIEVLHEPLFQDAINVPSTDLITPTVTKQSLDDTFSDFKFYDKDTGAEVLVNEAFDSVGNIKKNIKMVPKASEKEPAKP